MAPKNSAPATDALSQLNCRVSRRRRRGPARQHRSALHHGRRAAPGDDPERPGQRGVPPRDASRRGQDPGHHGGGSGQCIEQMVKPGNEITADFQERRQAELRG